MKKALITGISALALTSIYASQNASAQNAVEVGLLHCSVAGGVGFIFGSSRDMDCKFEQAGHVERYTGTINKYGVDIGVTGKSHLAWAVLSPRLNLNPGALSGNYGGASAGATAGVGVGVNALFGAHNSLTLQPVSVQAQTGINVAAGITSITLEPRK